MPKAEIPTDPLSFIKACLFTRKVRWTYHVSMRLQQRSLSAEMLLNAISSLEIIEPYTDDKYLPSFLIRGEIEGLIFHAQIATDVEGDNVRVVTMYLPTASEWDRDFRIRSKPL